MWQFLGEKEVAHALSQRRRGAETGGGVSTETAGSRWICVLSDMKLSFNNFIVPPTFFAFSLFYLF